MLAELRHAKAELHAATAAAAAATLTALAQRRLAHRLYETEGLCTRDGFFAGGNGTRSHRRLQGACMTGRGTCTDEVTNCTIVSGRRPGSNAAVGLALVGCARRIAGALSNRTVPYMDRLLQGANDTTMVIIYHDAPSGDEATVAVLRAWAERERRVRLILSDVADRGDRISRLALCRNVLLADALSHLRPNGALAQFDLDCEFGSEETLLTTVGEIRHAASRTRNGSKLGGGLLGPPQHLRRRFNSSSSGATAADGRRKGGGGGKNGTGAGHGPHAHRHHNHPHVQHNASAFDVVTTNNEGAYRDMWALRSSTLGMDYDCFWDFGRMKSRGNCKRHRMFVSPTAAPFAVEAAFNGLAIYSAAALRGVGGAAACRYANPSAAGPDPTRDCPGVLKRMHVRAGRPVRLLSSPWRGPHLCVLAGTRMRVPTPTVRASHTSRASTCPT